MQDDCPRRRGTIDVTADNLADVLLLPTENFGDDALRQTGDIELGRRRAAQIVEMQITDTGSDLRPMKRCGEPAGVHGRPRLFVKTVVERFGMRASTSRSPS